MRLSLIERWQGRNLKKCVSRRRPLCGEVWIHCLFCVWYLEYIQVPSLAGLFGSVMVYSAVGLALIGAVAGFAFRWKVLLPVVVLLPFAAIIFSLARGFGTVETVMVIAIAEGILQGGYVLGLTLGFLATAAMPQGRASSSFKARSHPEERNKDGHTSPPAGAGEAP